MPEHGNGAIRHGSAPGNTPGSGRPPSAVKATAREAFDKRIPLLETFADSEEVSVKERRLAIVALGTFGLQETRLSVEFVKEKLAETTAILDRYLTPEQRVPVYNELRALWRTV